MKTKIKTAKERVDEYFQREKEIATANFCTTEQFPEQRAHLLKMLDIHARRARERHARKNVCFIKGEVLHKTDHFIYESNPDDSISEQSVTTVVAKRK